MSGTNLLMNFNLGLITLTCLVGAEEFLVTYLTESMTNTTSSMVILVSAMFVERMICKNTKITTSLATPEFNNR